LGSSFFNDIDGSEGPKDNAYNGAPGYSAQAGWDACTGWGSINGTELLSGLKQVFTERCYIIPFFPIVRIDVTKAFSLRVGGFRPEDFGIQSGPPVTSSINPVITITATPPIVGKVSCTLIEIDVQDETLPPTPQLFTWRYHVTFPASVTFIRLSATLTSSKGDSVISGAVITSVLGA
jgi:kumamolisin